MNSERFFFGILITIRLCLSLILLLISMTAVNAQKVPVLDWVVGAASATSWYSVHGMTTDASGNTILCGYFSGTIDMDPGPGVQSVTAVGYDFCVVKVDPNGNLLWAKAFGGTADDDALDIDTDAIGNVYIGGSFGATVDFDPGVGTSDLTTTGSYDAFLLKLDADGNFVWVKQIGGVSIQEIQAIKVIPSGGFAIAGRFAGVTDLDPGAGTTNITSLSGSSDVFVERLDSDGNFMWASRLGGTTTESVSAIDIDNALNVYTTGEFGVNCDFDPGAGVVNLTNPFPGSPEVFASKLDMNGNFVWARKITEAAAPPGVAYRSQDLHVDLNNNVILSGNFLGTVDFDPSASTFNLTSASMDSYVSKLDADGNFLWAGSFRGSGSISENNGFSLDTDANGNVFIAGAFRNLVDFDPGPLTSFITAPAAYAQTYITKLAPDGSFIWARAIGGSTNTPGSQNAYVDITSTGNIHVAGKFKLTRNFDPTPCRTYNVVGDANDALFITRLSEPPLHTITSFTPISGPIGTPVTIDGTNFKTIPAENEVRFFNNRLASVTASTAATITTEVPALATTGRISVIINCVTVQSVSNFTVTVGTVPTITSFTPTSGVVGTTVTITGTNFSGTPANNTVQFNGTTATATASTTTTITTTVPSGATTGKITVTVAGNTATSATDFTVTTPSLPTITSFTPASGPTGTAVTITGTNFSATSANNVAKFNGTTSTVSASTTTSITTTVPSGATTGKITVTVGGNTATSATDFTVTAPTGIVISPQPQSVSACEGENASMTLAASGAASITYQWQKFNGAIFTDISNGGGYSGVTTSTLNINATGNFGAGDYRCRVSGNSTPDVFSSTTTFTVNPFPLANITLNGTQLTVSSGDSYQWYQNDEEVVGSNNQTFVLSVLEYGVYKVDVTDNGCTTTSSDFVFLITENVESMREEWRVHPNPFTTEINISSPSMQSFEIELVDALGRQIQTTSSSNNLLDTRNLNVGQYILLIHTDKKTIRFRVTKMFTF